MKSFIDAADRSLGDTYILKEKTVKKLEQKHFVNRAESIVEAQKQQYDFKTISVIACEQNVFQKMLLRDELLEKLREKKRLHQESREKKEFAAKAIADRRAKLIMVQK